jgi:Zn-dependent M28 family amino/carboxypeptidase
VAAILVAASGLVLAGQTARPSTLIDSVQLLTDVRVLSADDMQGREVGTEGNARARAYIVERFRASGLETAGPGFEQPFTFTAGRGDSRRTVQGVNVVGRVRGRAAQAPAIVLTAHYDHLGTRNGEVFNGADDNASGTAALFALAKHFSSNPTQYPLLVVALDGEEAGLQGARAFLARPPVPVRSMALNLNVDMIGREPNNRLFAAGTSLHPFLKPYIQRIAARAPVMLLMGHDEPGRRDVEDWTRDSDHWAFLQANVPALYFGVEDYAEHHKATDDYATMTHDFYVRAVETLVLAIQEFDTNLAAVHQRR